MLVAAPVALLAQSYSKIFAADIDANTLHGAFNIPVHGAASGDVNYTINKYEMVVVDETSMISAATFNCYLQSSEPVTGCHLCRRPVSTAAPPNSRGSYHRHHLHHQQPHLHFSQSHPSYALPPIPHYGSRVCHLPRLHSVHSTYTRASGPHAGRHHTLPSRITLQ